VTLEPGVSAVYTARRGGLGHLGAFSRALERPEQRAEMPLRPAPPPAVAPRCFPS